MEQAAHGPRRAIVLSGGGARGAYEAGVLRYLLDELPRRLGRDARFDLVLGTSVGAIHACWLAATAHLGTGRGARLCEAWRGMRLEELLGLTLGEVLRIPGRALGLLGRARARRAPDRLHGLLDTRALDALVVREIPWPEIRSNVEAGRIRTVCVTATEIATGRAVLFAEGRDVARLRRTPDPTLVAREVALQPGHALASAAIPLLFPAVQVDGEYYVDGGLRLNTPLAPAIHLGAERILVVALRPGSADEGAAAPRPRTDGHGGRFALYGKVLNALLVDPLDADLGRMRFVNAILRQGEEAFGGTFLERLNQAAGRSGGSGYRVIDACVIRPSASPGRLAGEVLKTRRSARFEPLARAFLGLLGSPHPGSEDDLLSYLLFDEEFTGALAEMGARDARGREGELAAFFADAE